MPSRKLNTFVLQVHITGACPNNCTHCYQRDAAATHMEPADFYALLQQFEQLLDHLGKQQGSPVDGIVSLTGGEPLAHPHFADFALAVWRQGFQLAVLTSGRGWTSPPPLCSAAPATSKSAWTATRLCMTASAARGTSTAL